MGDSYHLDGVLLVLACSRDERQKFWERIANAVCSLVHSVLKRLLVWLECSNIMRARAFFFFFPPLQSGLQEEEVSDPDEHMEVFNCKETNLMLGSHSPSKQAEDFLACT